MRARKITRLLALPLLLCWICSPRALADETKELKAGKLALTVKLRKGADGISLELLQKGKLIQKFESLGVSLFPIDVEGKKLGLVTRDLDGDGDEEVLFRTTQPPVTGSLWIMRWDKAKKLLFHATNDHGDRYLSVPQETVTRLTASNEIQFQTAVSKTVMTFRWNGKFFVEK